MRRGILRTMMALAAVLAAYATLLAFPEPLFTYHVERGNARLYSDRPLPSAAAGYLDAALVRLARSPWDNPALSHRIFLCQNRWHWLLFTLLKHKVGAINCVYLNRNIFLRNVNWATGRIIAESGREVEGERDLPYYLAHEMAHGLTVARIGRWRYYRSESWKREGYADYVGMAAFDFGAYLEKFRRGDPKMDPASGYYWRYLLLVGFVLDREKAGPDFLFADTRTQAEMEAALQGM